MRCNYFLFFHLSIWRLSGNPLASPILASPNVLTPVGVFRWHFPSASLVGISCQRLLLAFPVGVSSQRPPVGVSRRRLSLVSPVNISRQHLPLAAPVCVSRLCLPWASPIGVSAFPFLKFHLRMSLSKRNSWYQFCNQTLLSSDKANVCNKCVCRENQRDSDYLCLFLQIYDAVKKSSSGMYDVCSIIWVMKFLPTAFKIRFFLHESQQIFVSLISNINYLGC